MPRLFIIFITSYNFQSPVDPGNMVGTNIDSSAVHFFFSQLLRAAPRGKKITETDCAWWG